MLVRNKLQCDPCLGQKCGDLWEQGVEVVSHVGKKECFMEVKSKDLKFLGFAGQRIGRPEEYRESIIKAWCSEVKTFREC